MPEKDKQLIDWEEFNSKVGLILAYALNVEQNLEFFISNYFIKPQTSKTFFLEDLIRDKIRSFEAKRDIFKKICKREKYKEENEELYQNTVDAIKYVIQERNKVAHWSREKPHNAPTQLRKRKEVTTNTDVCKLTDEFVEKYQKTGLKAINGITEFHLKYMQEGTIDEKESSTI